MDREGFKNAFCKLLRSNVRCDLRDNFILLEREAKDAKQSQTNKVFSDKWKRYEKSAEKQSLYDMQKRWYLKLYGFNSEKALAAFLRVRKVIFDAGCGLGFKSAWFAQLAPKSLVIGMDFSDSAKQAACDYKHIANLFFMQGDIANTQFPSGCMEYVSCDQVIMHTQKPEQTFSELARITKRGGGEIACYFYAKKAVPRELLDEYFRSQCARMRAKELWEMSEQLSELGKRLSELKISFDAPDVPALGIKGGHIDLQRFIYWNFMKCFWNEELGWETSTLINYDWYSPKLAKRYSKQEVIDLVEDNGLSIAHFHQEDACYSGRFVR